VNQFLILYTIHMQIQCSNQYSIWSHARSYNFKYLLIKLFYRIQQYHTVILLISSLKQT